uniref:Uncharacterized protein n=1 Tax=Glossina morsitans morsitans TaxID=37546 RepID=A0A1B0GDQ6_GLOMM
MTFFIIGSVGLLHPASSSIALIASVSVPITELFPERRLFIDWCFQMSYDLPHSLSSFYNVPIWPNRQNSKHQKRESSFLNQTLWSPWEKYNALTFTKRHPSDFTANELYQGIEDILNSYGFHANCLLLSICELAQHPFADDDVNELTNILTFVLSPSLHGSIDHRKQLNVELYEDAELNGLLETKRYINVTANPQSDFQANPNEIWTFRSSSLKRSKRTFLAYGMGGVVKVSVREHTPSKKYWELCIPKSL